MTRSHLTHDNHDRDLKRPDRVTLATDRCAREEVRSDPCIVNASEHLAVRIDLHQ